MDAKQLAVLNSQPVSTMRTRETLKQHIGVIHRQVEWMYD